MTRFLVPMVASLVIIFAVVSGLAWYVGSSPNKQHYTIYIDEKNRIFVNGERATEERVYRLGRDMTVDIEIKRHSQASLSFCFQERGCTVD
ncbi:hypothetical protein [Litorivivens sp.]|uniref:hypothetical protein n=1 Tax=Litorivivens sp. TaxID=2020868 RepID=UPI003566D26A